MLSLKLTSFFSSRGKIHNLYLWIQSNWMSLFCCGLLIYLLAQKNITLQISLNNDFLTKQSALPKSNSANIVKAVLPIASPPRSAQQKKQLAYVKRFAEVAKTEMERFGIPASIKLAQGLLESQAGKSRLATRNNNHFGIKCFSKSCKKGHCSNFSDDSHKDFFRTYPSAWESYRAHSLLLQSARYQHLREKAVDYRGWAIGLQKAGYATDSQYAKKIIRLIEELELQQFDLT